MSKTHPVTPRFGPLDALILVASIALGLGIWATPPQDLESALELGDSQARYEREQENLRSLRKDDEKNPTEASLRMTLSRWKDGVFGVGRILLPFATLGAAIAVFRRRGAWSRRPLRRVGILTIAVVAGLVAAALANEFILRRSKTLQVGYSHDRLDSIWRELVVDMGLSVSALWVVLLLGRRWRGDPGWADRLGRILGAAWVAFALLGSLMLV